MKRSLQSYLFCEGLPFFPALIAQILCFLSENYRRDSWKVVTIPNDERLNALITYLGIILILSLSSLLLHAVRKLSDKPETKSKHLRQVGLTFVTVIIALAALFAICLLPFFLEMDSDGEWESVQSSSA